MTGGIQGGNWQVCKGQQRTLPVGASFPVAWKWEQETSVYWPCWGFCPCRLFRARLCSELTVVQLQRGEFVSVPYPRSIQRGSRLASSMDQRSRC